MAQKKKSKASVKTALILSSLVLCLCVFVLSLTVTLTANAQEKNATINEEFSKNDEKVEKSENFEKTENINKTSLSTETANSNGNANKTVTEKSSVSKTTNKSSSNKTSENKTVSVNKSSSVKNENQNEVEKNVKLEQNKVASAKPIPSVTEKKGKIYIVLDDGGHNLSQLDCFLHLPFPFAVAVLPHLVHSADSAKKVVESCKTLMLHQPMQAINLSVNPGPGSIQPEMSQSQVISVLMDNIENITLQLDEQNKKKLVGLNNHEGSLITENEFLIKAVMQLCKDKNMFFLDSRTNAKSVCRSVSNEINVEFFERDIFLDNTQNQDEMIAQFRKGVSIAEKTGSVIMIGHVWSSQNLADVLPKMYSEYSSKGFEFVSF